MGCPNEGRQSFGSNEVYVMVGKVDIKSMNYMETLWISIVGHDGNFLYIFDEVKAMAFS